MGPPPRSLALEANDCFMVQILRGSTEYKVAVREIAPYGGLPSVQRTTVGDPARFASSKAVGAHIGLSPRVYQSGEIDRSGQISKAGDKMLRHLLYEAASVLMTRNTRPSALRTWGIAIARRRGAKRARVAVARKLAVIMHRIWVSGGRFEPGAGSKVPAST